MHPFTTLIDAPTLAQHLQRDDFVILDCRFDLGDASWGEREYAVAHLPNAHYLHLDRDLSSPVREGTGRHPLPDPQQFARALASRGAGGDTQLVAYDQGSGMYAARLWWLARWIGHARVAVLDGGIAAWRAAGLPLTPALPAATPRDLPVHLDDHAWLTADAVEAARLRPGNLLIDARGADRFAGRNETIDPIAGHIPGGRNLPFAANLGTDNKFLSPESLRRRWQVMLGSLPPSAVIAMCGSGVSACHNLLALEHAGLGGARLYPGSWSEWIRDARRPIARGEH